MENKEITKNVRCPYRPVAQNETQQYYDMVVFCHLRWQFVYQRPQHIISRMAQEMKVLLIEEPIHFSEGEENTAEVQVISPQLHILQPKVRSIEAIAEVLPAYITNKNVSYGWFYSASFSPLLEVLSFDTVIYDCMDELSLFKGAPQQLIDQEKYLLSHADVVFTGGKSLYESKKQLHDNVYCFPSSVDQRHFAKALIGISIPEDIAGIDMPIVGYFGVIDERIDLEMVRKCAELMPDITFVMIGPLAKIHDEDLPRAENIRYLGMKSYEELPAYLKAFNIAMMPFALNESTIYISPTKTLEYMAAGKPIISTKIKDVVRDYSHCVSLVDTAAEFTQAVRELLRVQMSGNEYADILERTSWDSTAANMKQIIKSYS